MKTREGAMDVFPAEDEYGRTIRYVDPVTLPGWVLCMACGREVSISQQPKTRACKGLCMRCYQRELAAVKKIEGGREHWAEEERADDALGEALGQVSTVKFNTPDIIIAGYDWNRYRYVRKVLATVPVLESRLRALSSRWAKMDRRLQRIERAVGWWGMNTDWLLPPGAGPVERAHARVRYAFSSARFTRAIAERVRVLHPEVLALLEEVRVLKPEVEAELTAARERSRKASASLGSAARDKRRVAWADAVAIATVYAAAARVSRCLGVPHHVDHDIPLQGKRVSGLHVPLNLRVIPATLNLRKHNHFEVA